MSAFQFASEVYRVDPEKGYIQDAEINPSDLHQPYLRFGYRIGYLLSRAGQPLPEGGNTAIFCIHPKGMTEPVFVTKPEEGATFTITVVSGKGEMIRVKEDGTVETVLLLPDKEVVVRPGEAYSYKNTDPDNDLVLCDEAVPAFRDGDDVNLYYSVWSESLERPETQAGFNAYRVSDGQGSAHVMYLPVEFGDRLYAPVE